jgi:hypothetical protein
MERASCQVLHLELLSLVHNHQESFGTPQCIPESVLMLRQLHHALDVGRNWLPFQRKRRSVYQQWGPANSTELRVLAAATTKSEINVDTEYLPHRQDSSDSSFVSVKRTRVQKIFGNQFTGWRFGALHFSFWAAVVFSINLIVTVWGSTVRSSGILLEGECDHVELLNTGLHVLINVLSTILLSGSNYCMQCLSAPTREEVDKAHAQKRWLDIGIPSIRNVRHLGKKRIILWITLAITSLPLHLLYVFLCPTIQRPLTATVTIRPFLGPSRQTTIFHFLSAKLS